MKKIVQVKKRKEVMKLVTPRTLDGAVCGAGVLAPLEVTMYRKPETGKIKVLGNTVVQAVQSGVPDMGIVATGKSQTQMIRELRMQKLELEKKEGYCLSKREIGIRF